MAGGHKIALMEKKASVAEMQWLYSMKVRKEDEAISHGPH